MCVIDWNRTCGRPIECTRRRSKERDGTRPASTALRPPWSWNFAASDPSTAEALLATPLKSTGGLCPTVRSTRNREREPLEPLIAPRWRVVCPASPKHRCDDIHVRNVVRLVRVLVHHDEIREVPGDELAAAMLVARQPRGIAGRGQNGLVQREACLGVPR